MKTTSPSLSLSLLGSACLHVLFYGGLIYLSAKTFVPLATDNLDEMSVIPVESPTENPAGSAAEEEHLFDGMSYTQYQQGQVKAAQAKKASNLLGRLQGMKFADPSQVPGAASVPGANFQVGAGKNGLLTSMVSRQRFTVRVPIEVAKPQGTEGSRKMTDKERAELRQKFRALEPEFRKIYGHALTQDPHLQVTVNFEAEIQPTGFLGLSNFKAQGSYRPETLSLLKNGMGALIEKIYVAKDLSGAKIRGANIFVR
jgi:hypothetical protein